MLYWQVGSRIRSAILGEKRAKYGEKLVTAIAVRLEDRTGPWGKLVNDAIIEWLTSGKIVELERKWGIPQTKWLGEMTAKCKAKDPSCRADAPY